MSQLTSDAKAKLAATIRNLRQRLLSDLQNGAESTYRLSITGVAQAGLAQAQRERRQRLEGWLAEQGRADLAGQTLKHRSQAEAASRRRHLQEAIKLAGATLLNRLVVIKHLEAQGLIKPAVVTGGWKSAGYREFREFAPDLCKDETEGYGLLLQLLYDELALELPGVFGPVGLTELFTVPVSTLRAVVEALNDPALAAAWRDDTTLGWVYQYWNDPEREALDAKLNGGGKVEPHEVASKTQMFTERYMVEWLLQNSLGQQWLAICQGNGWVPEAVADGTLARLEERRQGWRQKRAAGEVALDALMPIETPQEERWKYWVPPSPHPEGDGPPESGSTPLSTPGEGLGVRSSIRQIKIFDPACGSGHFLVIAFDLLWAFYQEEARHRQADWSDQEMVESILENNLYGLDLDPRAVQVAAAALYLKAKGVCGQARPGRLNLVASNLNLAALPEDDPARQELRRQVYEATGIPEALTNQIMEALQGADQWGSLLKVDRAVEAAIAAYEGSLERGVQLALLPPLPGGEGEKESTLPSARAAGPGVRAILLAKLEDFLTRCTGSDDLGLRLKGEQLAAGVRFIRLVREGAYDLVVGNPPYQGASKMADARYLVKCYPRAKADLYAAFLERGLQLVRPGGLSALLTMRNWMFISQYSAIREYLIETYDLRTLGDFDRGAFDEVPNEILAVVLSIFQRAQPSGLISTAIQPTPFDDTSYDRQRTNRKRAAVLAQVGRFEFETSRFEVIKEKPIVYWWNQALLKSYRKANKLGDLFQSRKGTWTSNNARFLRFPYEIDYREFDNEFLNYHRNYHSKWIPYVGGAKGQKWIDTLTETLFWKQSGLEIKLLLEFKHGAYPQGTEYFFQRGIAFSQIGNNFKARVHRYLGAFGGKGSSIFPKKSADVLCAMNSQISQFILTSLNPGIGFEIGDVNRLPLFPIESAEEIFAQLDRAFTQHEAARETSVEFQRPGPSCWAYAQDWAQRAVDRPAGEALPPWEPVYEQAPATAWLSYGLGLALGRFPSSPQPPFPTRREGELETVERGTGGEVLPHGILYLSAHSGEQAPSPDNLDHPACAPLRDAWARHGGAMAKGKSLRDWLRLNFFKDVHVGMYEQRPIYFPLSSAKKTFVAYLSIHRWADNTLQTLLADYLVPEFSQIEGELADLMEAKGQGDAKAQTQAEKRYAEVLQFRDELAAFIQKLRQCAEQGPPPAHPQDTPRQADASFTMDLDDGVMVNSAALWCLLESQWSKPKVWWSELCNAKGKKDYDWAHLAARYFPQRVDAKCRQDPSLAVAHGVFWPYHPAKAYEWELRLQDEIGPDFTLNEVDSDQRRRQFEADHPDLVQALKDKEQKRRDRKDKKQAETDDQLNLEV